VLSSVRELVREAERFGVLVGIEGVERYVYPTRAGSGGCSTKWTRTICRSFSTR